eukprot:scaffold4007_cov49-Cyclotella_meneghiniana.AAC.3
MIPPLIVSWLRADPNQQDNNKGWFFVWNHTQRDVYTSSADRGREEINALVVPEESNNQL